MAQIWASLGRIPRPAQKKKRKKKKEEGKTLVHDSELTPPLVQAHGLGSQAEISARGT